MSGRPTCRKLRGFPAAREAASSRLTTSYGTHATRAANSGGGRRARKGLSRIGGGMLGVRGGSVKRLDFSPTLSPEAAVRKLYVGAMMLTLLSCRKADSSAQVSGAPETSHLREGAGRASRPHDEEAQRPLRPRREGRQRPCGGPRAGGPGALHRLAGQTESSSIRALEDHPSSSASARAGSSPGGTRAWPA